MKKQILSRGAMTLICSAILAACGSSGGGSLAVENAPNVPSVAELEQAKQAAANAEQKLSEAQQNLNVANQNLNTANQNLNVAQANGKTQADELAKLKQDLENAENAKKDANQKLQDAQKSGQIQADELAKLKQDLEKATTAAENAKKEADEAAKKAATELDKAKNDLKTAQNDLQAAKTQAKTELDEAKANNDKLQQKLTKAEADLKAAQENKANPEELEKLKTDLETVKKEAETAKNELDKLTNPLRQALNSSFGGKTASNASHYNSNTYQFTEVHTNIVSINHKDNKVSVSENPLPPTELNPNAIKINGTRIALLEKQVANGDKKLSLKALDETDFEVGKMPNGAKGWVGSLGDRANSPIFENMRFGVYVDENNVSHLFTHGKTTGANNIARFTEAYNFKGSAVIGKDGNYVARPDSIEGKVDFGKKEVDLTLKADDTKEGEYKLGGKISGNTFAGESSSGVYTQGAFYGTGGDTLGGVLQINEGKFYGYNGVYGAGRVIE